MSYSPVITRSAESTDLQNALHNLYSSGGLVGFISGPSGIGKTTYIQNLSLPDNSLRITTAAFEFELPSYYLISEFIKGLRNSTLNERLRDSQSENELSFFLSRGKTERLQSPEILFNAFKEIVKVISKIKPLVWIVEDIQWADMSSLALLENILPGIEDLPVAVIISYRTDNQRKDQVIRKLRSKLRRIKNFHEINLSEFTENEVSRYVGKKYDGTPDPEMIRTLYRHTGGLPLFISELANHLWDKKLIIKDDDHIIKLVQNEKLPVPESIRDLLLLQLNGLTHEARYLAEIAASYNIEFSFDFLANFTANPDAIDQLIASGIVMEKSPGKGVFRHVMVKETIQEEILWSKRKEIYRRIAIELEKHKTSPSLLADFWHKSGNMEKARPMLILSAKESCHVFAYQDAARWAEKALKDWPEGHNEEERIDLLTEFAHCCKISGNINGAIKATKELLLSEIVKSNPSGYAKKYRELAFLYSMEGAWANYRQAKTKAIELFRANGDYHDLVIELMELAGAHFKELKFEDALATIDQAMDIASEVPEKNLQARVLAFKGYVSAIYGNAEKGYQMAKDAVNIALKENDLLAISESYRRLAGTLEYSSKFGESAKAYEVALNFCETNGLDYEETQCLSCMAWVFLRTGEWRKCFETCRRVLENTSSHEISKCTALAILSLIRAYRGELKSAKKNLAETHKLIKQQGSALHFMLALWPAAIISMVEGDPVNSVKNFNQMLDFWFQAEDRHDSIPGLCDAVSFYALNKKQKELNRCIDALTYISNQTKNQEALGILSFALGASLNLKGENKPALDHLSTSIDYLESVNAPLQKSIVQFHRARVLFSLKKTEEATETMDAADRDFKNMGIRYWRALIEEEKNARISGKPDKQELKSDNFNYSLTDRQQEILKLLTKGLSNKEIANNLYLSPRTVDMHVRNIFDRLNCRTRAEATKIALENKLVE